MKIQLQIAKMEKVWVKKITLEFASM